MTVMLAGFGATLLVGRVAQAGAVILPATTLDGPSAEIVSFGGVAMAEDGTGGVVYLKKVQGVAHVFVARYVHGQWLAPVQVDTEQPYAASWPRIGAANDGELVVVWATPFATEGGQPVQELLSSTMGPGASRFGSAIVVDPNIGEGTGTSPDLAVSSSGQADLVYRVVENRREIPKLRPGDVAEEVRVAHYGGERWTRLGAANRDLGLSMRPPIEANAPQIAIGPTGNGVVVWQEPEINGVARIWARRIFSRSLDYVLAVTATTYGGLPINEDADAPSVAFSLLGQAEVVYRQRIGLGSPLPGPRIFLNILPDGESANGAVFEGASVIDANVAGGKSASLGRPSIDIDAKQGVRVLYDSDGTPTVVEGNDLGLSATLSLGPRFAGSAVVPAEELAAASVMKPEGGGVSAWPSENSQGEPSVAVREDFPSGAVQTGLISGAAGGVIGALAVGRSQFGDGLVAFQQGPLGDAAIVASQVTAPPDTFVVSFPKGWIKPNQAHIEWEAAGSANGPIRYAVVLDGRRLPVLAGASRYAFNPHVFTEGVYKVQLLATDAFGQTTLTAPTKLEVDGRPPAVKVARTLGGYGVRVKVSDSASGVDAGAVRISFGDGHFAHGRSSSTHRYSAAGVYTVTVQARDNLGNAETVRQLVHVR